MNGQKRITMKTGLVILISVFVVAATALGAWGAGQPLVQIEGQRLSIHAIHTPLETLLRGIANEGDIEIFLQGQLRRLITVEIENVPLENGLKRLLKGHNLAFTYGYNSEDVPVITQLYIYTATGSGDLAPIMPTAIAKARPPVGRQADNGIVIQTDTPIERDPLVSMQAIDPLMKINHAQAPYLPENFHKRPDHADSGSQAGPR
jgi:hypothetical protein